MNNRRIYRVRNDDDIRIAKFYGEYAKTKVEILHGCWQKKRDITEYNMTYMLNNEMLPFLHSVIFFERMSNVNLN